MGPVVLTSVWLHIIHHRCTLSSCSHFLSGEGNQGSCTYFLVLLHTYFLVLFLSSCPADKNCHSAPKLPLEQQCRHSCARSDFQHFAYVIREELCKRFEAKRFRPVMYLKGVLQQGVPMHSSTKRSQLPSSNNCLVQVVKAKAQRVCDLEQAPKTPDPRPCKPQSQQAVRLTHTQLGMLGQVGNIFFWSPIFYVFLFCKFLYFPFQAEYFTLMPLVLLSFPASLNSRKQFFFSQFYTPLS